MDISVSTWKKGHYASLVSHTQVAEHPCIKAKFQKTFFGTYFWNYVNFFIYCYFRASVFAIMFSFVLFCSVSAFCLGIVRDSVLLIFSGFVWWFAFLPQKITTTLGH